MSLLRVPGRGGDDATVPNCDDVDCCDFHLDDEVQSNRLAKS